MHGHRLHILDDYLKSVMLYLDWEYPGLRRKMSRLKSGARVEEILAVLWHFYVEKGSPQECAGFLARVQNKYLK